MPDLDRELARQERIYLTEPRSLDEPDDDEDEEFFDDDPYHADNDPDWGNREH